MNISEVKNWEGKHVIKLRNYKEPTFLEDPESEQLRETVEPWLTALFQSEHLSLLVGSGISTAVHKLATGEIGAGMDTISITEFKDEISQRSKKLAENSGRGNANIEDQIRTINELIRGLEVISLNEEYASLSENLSSLKSELNKGIESFANKVLETENNITSLDKDTPSEYLMNFLLSFASRISTRERLNLFTTNYDRVLEFGAELAGLHFLDRFVGSISPIFRSSRLNIDLHYNPPGIRGEPRYLEGVVNFTKLHGSLDWAEKDGVVSRFPLPYGAENISLYNQNQSSLMIYPNSSKDRETAEYPYVELFRDFASSIIRPNSTIVSYGYSFGDDHINRVLKDMLTIPSTHLVIIAHNDIGDRIRKFYSNAKRPVQISLLLGKHFGDLKTLVDYYLPKPAIDKTTYKMADLLKARGTAKPGHKESEKHE